ncbi:MAG: GAF domain-containing protein [Candidatus Scalinduaceae bacterium]
MKKTINIIKNSIMSNLTSKMSGLIKPKKPEIIEILLGFAIVIAINIFLFRDNMGFYGYRYHPYWIIILAIAARYGFRGGLMAGIIGGIVMLSLMKISEMDITIKQLMRYKFLETPLFFIVVGAFLGELREIQKRQFDKLNDEFRELQKSFGLLSKKYNTVSMAKQELDTRIIGQEQTISTLYESAQALKSLKEEDIYPAVLKILKNFVSSDECSIYKASEDKLKMIANLGWRGGNNHPLEVGIDEGIMGKAFSTGNTVTINDVLKVKEAHNFSDLNLIISSPITNSKKVVLGVLNIEKMPFVKFNPQSIKMASLLADWCGSALENAKMYKETKDKNIADEITGAYTYDYLCKRVEEEFQKARRYKFVFGILAFEIAEYDLIPEMKKQELLPVFNTIFRNVARKTDLLFVGNFPGIFIFLFPFTPLKGINVVKNKLINAINEFKFRPYQDESRLLEVYAGTAEFNDELETYTELIQMAIEDMNREKSSNNAQQLAATL